MYPRNNHIFAGFDPPDEHDQAHVKNLGGFQWILPRSVLVPDTVIQQVPRFDRMMVTIVMVTIVRVHGNKPK